MYYVLCAWLSQSASPLASRYPSHVNQPRLFTVRHQTAFSRGRRLAADRPRGDQTAPAPTGMAAPGRCQPDVGLDVPTLENLPAPWLQPVCLSGLSIAIAYRPWLFHGVPKVARPCHQSIPATRPHHSHSADQAYAHDPVLLNASSKRAHRVCAVRRPLPHPSEELFNLGSRRSTRPADESAVSAIEIGRCMVPNFCSRYLSACLGCWI